MLLDEIANAAETVLALTVLRSPCSVMVLVTAVAFPGYCVIWMETVSRVRPMVSVNQTTCCKTWGPRNKAQSGQVEFVPFEVVVTGDEVMAGKELLDGARVVLGYDCTAGASLSPVNSSCI